MKTKYLFRNTLAVLMSVILLISCILVNFPSASAATVGYGRNTQTRHIECTSLSEQAQQYYTSSSTYDYTYSGLSALSGRFSTDSYEASQNNELYTALYELMSSTQTSAELKYSGYASNSLATLWNYSDSEAGNECYTYFYADVPFSAVSAEMNREHIWPQSKASYYQTGGGADIHHLRPSVKAVNLLKSNYSFGEILDTEYEANAAKTEVNGNTVMWKATKPDDTYIDVNKDIRGDVARILLYVYVRWQQPNLYSNVLPENLPALDSDKADAGKTNCGEKIIESLQTLLDWCKNDPVDTWEMQRNDISESIQGNRNVFIDYPEFAWLLFDRDVPSDMQTPSGKAMENAVKYSIAYSATAASKGSGTITAFADGVPFDSGALVNEGAALTFIFTPDSNSQFAKVTANSVNQTAVQNGDSYIYTTTAAKNLSVKVTWAKNETVTTEPVTTEPEPTEASTYTISYSPTSSTSTGSGKITALSNGEIFDSGSAIKKNSQLLFVFRADEGSSLTKLTVNSVNTAPTQIGDYYIYNTTALKNLNVKVTWTKSEPQTEPDDVQQPTDNVTSYQISYSPTSSTSTGTGKITALSDGVGFISGDNVNKDSQMLFIFMADEGSSFTKLTANSVNVTPVQLGDYYLYLTTTAKKLTVKVTWTKNSENLPATTAPEAPETSEPATQEETEPVIQGIRGDFNLDGVVNIRDATEIQKYIVELVQATDFAVSLGDVNNNRSIDVNDATIIQKYIAELVDTL